MKTNWDLENLYYKNLEDPQIEKDMEAFEGSQESFAKKYTEDKSFLTDPKALKEALDLQEEEAKKAFVKPLYYLFFVRDLDATNTKALALESKLSERYTKAGNKTLFFGVELGAASKEQQEIFLNAPELEHYKYYLKELFENAQFTLSEKEEKILSLKSDVSRGRWVSMVSTIEAKKMVPFSDGDLPLPEALEQLNKLPKEKRRELWANIVAVLKDMGEMSAHEMNAVISNHKINGELRGYKTPEEPTVRGNENRQEVIDSLADTVTKAFSLSHRFYAAKAKYLGEELRYEDKNIDIGKFSTEFSFEKSIELVKDAFGEVNPLYAETFQRFLDNGQIDVYPKKGKSGGAFCAHSVGIPTMLLLNHVDNLRSFETLAHEMGHAIHSERSKTQSPMYEGYSTAVAETASTFFEAVVREKLLQELPEEDKLLLLHNSIQNDISSISRQTTFYNFERELHAKIREDGFVGEEDIAKMLTKHLKDQLGDAVSVSDDDGYSYIYISHFRNFFYVYTYTYGQLVSRALFARYKKDKEYAKQIDTFLTSGGSMPAEEIFENIGLSFKDGEVFKEGLKALEEDIEAFEKAVK
tara:strand:- start:179119 stop:180867 length:1749 start_codon:yes stop_codon:yes gene_type:complete